MLSLSLIVLLAASSSVVNGLPMLFGRQLPGVAEVPGLDALRGALGNIPGLDNVPMNVPGAGAAQPPAAQRGQRVGAGRGNRGNQAVQNGRAGPNGGAGRQNGANRGNKQPNANAGADLVNVTDLVQPGAASTTLVGGATEVVGNNTAVETGIGANNTAVATDIGANATATASPPQANATQPLAEATQPPAANVTQPAAGAGVVSTVTVTVTETVRAGNATGTGVAEGAQTSASEIPGATSTSLAPAVTSPPPAASSSSVPTAAGPDVPNISSLVGALPTFPPIQTPAAPGQGQGTPRQGQTPPGRVASVEDLDDEED